MAKRKPRREKKQARPPVSIGPSLELTREKLFAAYDSHAASLGKDADALTTDEKKQALFNWLVGGAG